MATPSRDGERQQRAEQMASMRRRRRMRRATIYALAVALALVAAAIGLAYLKHPIAGLAFGVPRRSDAPPVVGVGFLLVPVVVVGLGLKLVWQTLSLRLEVLRQRGGERSV